MEEQDVAGEEQGKVAAFMEITGEPANRAEQFLQATSWQLEEAIQLYFAGINEIGGGASPTALPEDPSARLSAAPAPFPPEQPGTAIAPFDSPRIQNDDYVRPPLPVRREALYDGISQFRGQLGGQTLNQPGSVDAFRNFEDEGTQRSRWGAEPSSNDVVTPAVVKDSLAAMYRPPFVLMFLGTFEQAKAEAARQEKWLLVNLQSTKEFSSYMLNRDTWAHEAVADTVGMSFVFWQVYDDTGEGRKVCAFYNLVTVPTTLVLDPITGQKMRSWEGMISPDRLLEDLVPFMDEGPFDKHGPCIPPQKRLREPAYSSSDATDSGIPTMATRMSVPLKQTNMGLSRSFGKGEPSAKLPCAEGPRQGFNLPEEPPPESMTACKVAFRFPNGRRSQRRFLLSDPIKYLWLYCATEVHEGESRPFRLTHAIPGASDVFVQNSDMSMLEAGVANSMLVMTWLSTDEQHLKGQLNERLGGV